MQGKVPYAFRGKKMEIIEIYIYKAILDSTISIRMAKCNTPPAGM